MTARKALFALLSIVLVFGMGFLKGQEYESAKAAVEARAITQRLEKERDDVQAELNQTARNWAEDQARSEGLARGTVDRLSESDVRLRVKLADATVREVQGYNRGVADGKAELHRETSEALVRITQDADRHVEALQETLKAVTHE